MTPRTTLRLGALALCIAAAAVAGCGGGGSGARVVPGGNAGGSQSNQLARMTLHIVVPERTTNGKRRPMYISPSTQQLAWTLNSAPQSPIALTTADPNCTNSGSGLSCTVSLPVTPVTGSDTDTLSFTLEDASGNALSSITNVTATPAPGSSTTLNLTLGGIAASFNLSSTSTNFATPPAGSVYTVYGNAAISLTINALDADNNVIVGAGAPTVTATLSPIGTSPPVTSTLTAGTANTWTLTSGFQPTSPTQGGIMALQVAAAPYPGSGASAISGSFNLQFFTPWIFVGNAAGAVHSYSEVGAAQMIAVSPSPGAPVSIAFGDTSSSTASPLPSPYLFVANQVPGPTPTPVPSVTPVPTAGPTSTPSGSMFAYNGDGSKPTLTGSFSGLGVPTAIAFDTHDNDLYVANIIGSSLQAFDSQGNAVALSAATINGPTGIAFDGTNDDIYVSTSSNVYAYTESGSAVSVSFSSLNTPSGIAYDSNLNEILVLNKGNATVGLYSPTGGGPTSSFSVVASPTAILFDPYTKWIYVANASGIKAYDESGNQQTLSGSWSSLGTPTSLTVVL